MAIDRRGARVAETIDDVIERLDDILHRARTERSRTGYFAALYRSVTIRVKERIAAGHFADGGRMERLDVAFANRYLAALDQARRGERPSQSWHAAFDAGTAWRPIVLQHLLLGMNAHINLDLGMAAAETCPGERLGELREDFDAINAILAAMTDDVQERLCRIWPALRWLDRVGGNTDEAVLHFSMLRARNAAWSAAERLASLQGAAHEREVARIDRSTTFLAHLIRHPGRSISLVNLWIRLREGNDVVRAIDALT